MTAAWPGKDGSGVWAWAFVVCAVTVLVLALISAPPPVITTGWDKSNHLLAFGAMTWLGCKAFPQRSLPLLLGLLAYGVVIEILQSFTPNRSGAWLDLLADCLGMAPSRLRMAFHPQGAKCAKSVLRCAILRFAKLQHATLAF